MIRALSVLVGVLVLLSVGWFLGNRPVSGLKSELEQQTADFAVDRADLELKANLAEARGFLWTAHAELLLAGVDLENLNFGTAADRVSRAQDFLTRAAGKPGMTVDLETARTLVASAVTQIGAMNQSAGSTVARAAEELGRVLEKAGRA